MLTDQHPCVPLIEFKANGSFFSIFWLTQPVSRCCQLMQAGLLGEASVPHSSRCWRPLAKFSTPVERSNSVSRLIGQCHIIQYKLCDWMNDREGWRNWRRVLMPSALVKHSNLSSQPIMTLGFLIRLLRSFPISWKTVYLVNNEISLFINPACKLEWSPLHGLSATKYDTF